MQIENWREQGRKDMVILVDTNIIIDVLANREPYAEDAKKILEKCATKEVKGVLAAHSIPNLFYILRKAFNQEERRFLLKNLCKIFQISDLNAQKIIADYIVTRNPVDFKNSRIKVIQPEELLKKI